MHHKRHRNSNQRAGCKLCKPWKRIGITTESVEGEKFSDHTRREAAEKDFKEVVLEEFRNGLDSQLHRLTLHGDCS